MKKRRIAIICWMTVALSACSTPAADGLKHRAEQGDALAQYELGKHYSARQSYTRALPWLRKAAENGHAGAQNRLGVMCERGEGVPMNLVEAYKWYTLAAEAGNTFAAANGASLEPRLTPDQIAAAEASLRHLNVARVSSR